MAAATPPQRPSWPWSGRNRRSNSESALPTLRDLVTGRRNSLSSTDVREANVLRKKPPPEISTPKSRPQTANVEKREPERLEKAAAAAGPVAGPDGAKTWDMKDGKPQKSQSR